MKRASKANTKTAPRQTTPHTRLGSAFPLSAINLQVTPSFGPAVPQRWRRTPWSGPEFLSFPLYNVDIGSLTYCGVQEIGIGSPALGVP
jgi:hypothetical protein